MNEVLDNIKVDATKTDKKPDGKSKKYIKIAWIVGLSIFVLAIIIPLVSYLVYEYEPIAKVGDTTISRHEIKKNIPANETYLKKIKGEGANLFNETYNLMLEEEVTEYESTKNGISVDDSELSAEIKKLSTDETEEQFYKRYSDLYAWDKATLQKQIKGRLLKEKLEAKVVANYNVSFLFARSDAEPMQGETIPQIKQEAKDIVTKAKVDVKNGKSIHQIPKDIEATSKTWADMSLSSGEVKGLNSTTEKKKLMNSRFWPEIQKLQNQGDQTPLMDLTDEGGLYIFWHLDSKNDGQFNTMEEVYASYEVTNSWDKYLEKIVPFASAACSTWINVNANTTAEKNHYRVDAMQIQVRESVTHHLITPNDPAVKIRLVNKEAATGHCDASWCLMDKTDTMNSGADGQATFYDTCCQFTYGVYVDNLSGYSYSYTTRRGIEGPDDNTTAYPPKFNANNGVDNVYGDMYYDARYSLTINPTGLGSGNVKASTSTWTQINCNWNGSVKSGTCSYTYTAKESYDVVTLTSTPSAGSLFNSYSGTGCSTTSKTCSMTLNSSRTITARFDKAPVATLKVSVNIAGAGVVKAGAGNVFPGINCTSTSNTMAGCNSTSLTAGNAVLTGSDSIASAGNGNFFLGVAKAANGYTFKDWRVTYNGVTQTKRGGTIVQPVALGATAIIVANFQDVSLTCTPTPQVGLSPLVVKVDVNRSDGADTKPYRFDMGDGTTPLDGRNKPLYYTYGVVSEQKEYTIKVTDITGKQAVCSPGVVVKPITTNNGGEVAP